MVISEQIQRTEARLRQLRERQKQIDARARLIESKRERKNDTRRKILAGAWLLAHRPDLVSDVMRSLSRPHDLEAFKIKNWTPPAGGDIDNEKNT